MKEKLKLKPADSLVDLGCGDWKMLRFFAKHYSIKKLDGYEIHGLAIVWWKFLQLFNPNRRKIRIIWKGFEHANLSKYDYIFTYLLTTHLAEIEDRVFSSMKKDAIIISNTFRFKKHKPFKIIEDSKISSWKIYLYKKW